MRRAIVLLLLVGVAACRSTGGAPPPVPPARTPVVTRTEASHAAPLHFGSPTRAEIAALTTLGLDDALAVRARFVVVGEKPRLASAAPLDHRVRAVIDPATGEARLAPVLAAGGLFIEGDAAHDTPLAWGQLVGDVATALPDEVTVRVAAYTERPEPSPLVSYVPASLVTEKLAVLLRRRCVGHTKRNEPLFLLDVAVEVASFEPPAPPPEPPVAPGREDVPVSRRKLRRVQESAASRTRERTELLELRSNPVERRATFAIAVPSPFAGMPGWIVAVIDVAPAPLPSAPGAGLNGRAVAEVQAQLAGERAGFSRWTQPEVPLWVQAPVDRRSEALPELYAEMRTWPRRGLVRLAELVGAVIALDSALELEGASLLDVTSEVERALTHRGERAAIAAALGDTAGAALGSHRPLRWEVDLAALEALLRPQNRKRARSILERRYGAAFEADVSGSGRPVLPRVRQLRSHEEGHRLLLERNLLALEDTRPGVRIVASRWLRARYPGLAGYDPFGPFEERRVAVDRLWQALVPEEKP